MEKSLVDAASRGDAEAIEELLARHLPGLERYLARQRGGISPGVESGADLAQSVCREVLEHLKDARLSYRGEAEFKRWLYNAARIKLREKRRYWRAARRDPRREVRPETATDRSRATEFFRTLCTPSSEAARREELSALRAAFDRLPENYRRIIDLAHFQGLPHADIGARLGLTEANSRMLLSRALARLATLAARKG